MRKKPQKTEEIAQNQGRIGFDSENICRNKLPTSRPSKTASNIGESRSMPITPSRSIQRMSISYYLKAYGKKVVNYNRDIEAFNLLKWVLEKITGEPSVYQSPTDMGVNRASSGIFNDAVVSEASHQEIIRRYFHAAVDYASGIIDKETLNGAARIMKKVGAKVEDRFVVLPARNAAKEAEVTGKGNAGTYCGAAVQLHDGTIITGKNSPLMHAASSMVLNATKHLAGLPDAKMALEKLTLLNGCEVHLTRIPTPGDDAGLRKLQVNLTIDPKFAGRNLFIG
jgi:uncharacterized protein (UPF0371 family)